MRHEDWLQRWREDRTPFHSSEVNRWLVDFAGRLTGNRPRRILVPLCGKSLDMGWLLDRGHEVVGVELAKKALASFHQENRRDYDVSDEAPFRVFRSRGFTGFAGNFFELDADRAGPCDAAYDRAALIALPRKLRRRYAEHLLALLDPASPILLIGMEYDTGFMEGPPFSVPPEEVRRLFPGAGRFEILVCEESLERHPAFKENGLPWLRDYAVLITTG